MFMRKMLPVLSLVVYIKVVIAIITCMPTRFYNLFLQALEAAGVLTLYRRSEEKNKLRYIPFIGDGDSKAYSEIDKAKPYGPAVFIPKEECISHVTKHMGTNLRNLIKEYKGTTKHFHVIYCRGSLIHLIVVIPPSGSCFRVVRV